MNKKIRKKTTKKSSPKYDRPGITIFSICALLIFGIFYRNYSVSFLYDTIEIVHNPESPATENPAQQVDYVTYDYLDIPMLQRQGVLFPEVAFAIWFKETSFCRCDGEVVSLCCRELENNPHNLFGMKHPTIRDTKSLGRTPIDNLHASFASVNDAIEDFRLYQQHIIQRLGLGPPQSPYEFIDMLERAYYNPKKSYFRDLERLVRLIIENPLEFEKRYEKYYFQRTGRPLNLNSRYESASIL